MSSAWKKLPKKPLDEIMQANAEWPEFQKVHQDAINTTIGVLIDPDSGKLWRPAAITNALSQTLADIVETKRYGYQQPRGNARFLSETAKLVFGSSTRDLLAYQTLAGTGALSLAKELLEILVRPQKDAALSLLLDSGWPNHPAIFTSPYTITTYAHLDESGAYNHAAALEAARGMPQHAIFLLQVGGYNDDGADRSQEQWDEILAIAEEKQAVVILDTAYMGLAHGFETDRYPIVASVAKRLLTLVCFSTSKNMGLYNERVGALLIANSKVHLGESQMSNLDQAINRIVRRTISNAPLLAAEAAGLALASQKYFEELEQIRLNLIQNRQIFAEIIGEKAPYISSGNGLFTKLSPRGFSQEQLDYIRSNGILVLSNSRINLGGLQPGQIERVASTLREALD